MSFDIPTHDNVHQYQCDKPILSLLGISIFFCTFGIIFTDIRVITPLLYSGKSVALLITLTPWSWFSDWKDGKLKHRGDDYNALKDKIGRQMWKQTEELFPQLAGTVCYKIFYVTPALTFIALITTSEDNNLVLFPFSLKKIVFQDKQIKWA